MKASISSANQRSWVRKFAKPIVAIVTSVICLTIAEMALRIFSPLPDPYIDFKYKKELNQYIKSEFPKNLQLVTEPEEGLSGVHGPNRFTINNMGFRGDYLTVPKPTNEFRIFMVGGSTTECLYLDDSKAITRVLQDELGKTEAGKFTVKVYGAGKSGDASDDHCSMIVHRIVQLEPDMIILFAGVNDLTRSIFAYDYSHYVSETPPQKIPLLRSLATESQIVRRVRYLFRKVRPNRGERAQDIYLHSRYREEAQLCASTPISDQKPRVDVTGYANNLKTIAGVARAHGIQIVLMTQLATWNSPNTPNLKEWQSMLCRGEVRYREDLMDEALEAFNNQMRQTAQQYSVPLYDLARVVPKSRDFFFDDVHFNDQGAHVAGVQLAALIQQLNLTLDRRKVPVPALTPVQTKRPN